VAAELARRVGEKGLVVGLDFSMGMLGNAKERAEKLNLDGLFLVQSYAHLLPFKAASFDGVTCSHAFFELKGEEKNAAVNEAARVLKKGGRFCLMEHAKPKRLLLGIFFYIRILFLGSKDAKMFSVEEACIFPKDFENVRKMRSPTGQSMLIYGERNTRELNGIRNPFIQPGNGMKAKRNE
jgi:SAM-dependent methyltransferase